ncbi:biopolymer transporter ExbD [Advenella mimigardefordensis]|uniref:Putative TonB system biopolymer transport protein ExbB n=1 Tax=Advenella mimigardefordensis (strain DSM 17166 / LMG 22922 / DPN7) TaxID=1247726 RepID=W0PEF7_ADVMD|nr:biopolymer transporter ExbD [Advenella mimigardefordensis]AHG65299.1 putative TonB system biopolymer transport protein ExbB [Advenella mimigardefordensis DPN7]
MRIHDIVQQESEISDINVTPFIDVMLVLLVIFMVVVPVATVSVPLTLPVARDSVPPAQEKPVMLSMNRQHELYLDAEPVQMTELVDGLTQRTQGNRETIVFLQIDKEVAYDQVMQLMNLLRQAGYLKLGLVGLDEQEAGDAN